MSNYNKELAIKQLTSFATLITFVAIFVFIFVFGIFGLIGYLRFHSYLIPAMLHLFGRYLRKCNLLFMN